MISLHIDVLASEGTKKLHLSPEVIEIPNFVRQLIYAPFLRFDELNLFRDLFFEDLRIPRPTAWFSLVPLEFGGGVRGKIFV